MLASQPTAVHQVQWGTLSQKVKQRVIEEALSISFWPTYMHMRTHTHVNTCMHSHTRICEHMHAHTYVHIHTIVLMG